MDKETLGDYDEKDTPEFHQEGKVLFKDVLSDEVHEGVLVRDSEFWGGYKVEVPNASHSIKSVTIIEHAKTLFEDFTTLRWVRWKKRPPEHNGSVYVRWNGKYTSNAIVHNGELLSLDGDRTKYRMEDQKLIAEYTEEQKQIMEDMYWLEEIHDMEAFDKYRTQHTS